MKQNTEKNNLWFKRKLYGWGWTPATWQGWLVILLYLILMFYIGIHVDKNSHSASDTLLGVFIPLLVSTIVLIYICYKKGEKPRWQWGRDKGEDRDVPY